jgi:S-adenosylmethionine:tRNA ribosyltransferase-isomerase
MLPNVKNISINDFTYLLPDERIAKYPLEKRDESKLLVYQNEVISDFKFNQISSILDENALLISNETKVIAARLLFQTSSGANIEVFCLEPYSPAEINQSLQSNTSVQWMCMIGNSKKWKPEESLTMACNEFNLIVKKVVPQQNGWVISFEWDQSSKTFADILSQAGHIPLPPYLNRTDEESDKVRYQTIFAKHEGSVAAPTAGLHFSNEVVDDLAIKNIHFATVTLHVGAGTFLPVKSDTLEGHHMHEEIFMVTLDSLHKIRNNNGQRIVVGTTSLRTIESLYWTAVQLQENATLNLSDCHVTQWMPYEKTQTMTANEALDLLIHHAEKNNLVQISGKTSLLIAPGYDIKMVDGIITNFHQPNSTLLLLISAMVGDDWQKIYAHALQNNYRFLSFGDSSLLMKKMNA